MTTATMAQIVQRNGDLLNEKETADLLDVKPGTLSVWRSTGRHGLPFVKVGRAVRYSRKAIESWLESRTRSTGATA